MAGACGSVKDTVSINVPVTSHEDILADSDGGVLFGRTTVLAMWHEMVVWLATVQVTDETSPDCGAIIYSSDNRICNRDTACAAAAFMRQGVRTGETV